jgi:hypothetical protein
MRRLHTSARRSAGGAKTAPAVCALMTGPPASTSGCPRGAAGCPRGYASQRLFFVLPQRPSSAAVGGAVLGLRSRLLLSMRKRMTGRATSKGAALAPTWANRHLGRAPGMPPAARWCAPSSLKHAAAGLGAGHQRRRIGCRRDNGCFRGARDAFEEWARRHRSCMCIIFKGKTKSCIQ